MKRDSERDLKVETDMYGRFIKVEGPVYSMQYDRDDPLAYRDAIYTFLGNRVLYNPRQSGHEIEGYVNVLGKRYSAFTSGGENPDGGDGCIIIRSYNPRLS